MNNIIKRIIVSGLSLALMLSGVVFIASAAGTTIYFSSKNPTVNENFNVTVTVNTGEKNYGVSYNVVYNASIVRFNSGEGASGGAGSVSVVLTSSGDTKKSTTLSFTAISAGSSDIKVINCQYATDKENSFPGATANISVKDQTKSDNADLKSLTISNGTLSPKFSTGRTSYTATVENNVTECKVYATASDTVAKVDVSGKSALDVGKNLRTVTVTAASGKQKQYSISITRKAENDNTTSEVTEPDWEEPQLPLNETSIDDVLYTISTDISEITVPNEFQKTTEDYNGTTVAVARDKNQNYTIYYLKASGTDNYVPYILNENKFTKLKYYKSGENIYILSDFPTDKVSESGFYKTNSDIGGFNIACYANNDSLMSDFVYLYCYYKNNFGTYRYDKQQGVLQRSPDFKLIDSSSNVNHKEGILSRFKLLSTNSKVVVVTLFLAALAVLALIALIIIKLVKGSHTSDDEYSNDMMFQDNLNSEFISGEENNKTDSLK